MPGTGMKQKRNGSQKIKGAYVKYVSSDYFVCSSLADFDWVRYVYICILKTEVI